MSITKIINKDVLKLILSNLKQDDLRTMVFINKYFYKICDNSFWCTMIHNLFKNSRNRYQTQYQPQYYTPTINANYINSHKKHNTYQAYYYFLESENNKSSDVIIYNGLNKNRTDLIDLAINKDIYCITPSVTLDLYLAGKFKLFKHLTNYKIINSRRRFIVEIQQVIFSFPKLFNIKKRINLYRILYECIISNYDEWNIDPRLTESLRDLLNRINNEVINSESIDIKYANKIKNIYNKYYHTLFE